MSSQAIKKKTSPRSLDLINIRGLSSQNNAADFIIITHRDFRAAAEKLATWKIEKGLATIVVDVDEVYDEFNHGIKHPVAIRNFLQFAHEQWKNPKPRYVLLIGDATWHINNLIEDGEQGHSFIPTSYYQDTHGGLEYATDNWYVSFGNPEDASPDMAIGRFPVETFDHAMSIVDKTIEYEKNNAPNEWHKRCLIMTSQERYFQKDGESLARDHLPSDFTVTFAFKNRTESPTEVIVDAINNGTLFTIFIGHGAADIWGGDKFFQAEDLSLLNNKGQYPISVAITCYTTSFDTPPGERLNMGEELLRLPDAGSVVVIGTTWRSLFWEDFKFLEVMLDDIFENGYRILGDAFVDVKKRLSSKGISHRYVILGDPSLELPRGSN